MKMLQLLLLQWSLLKLGLGQLSSVQQVSIELTQSVEFLLTNHADVLNRFLSHFVVMSFCS